MLLGPAPIVAKHFDTETVCGDEELVWLAAADLGCGERDDMTVVSVLAQRGAVLPQLRHRIVECGYVTVGCRTNIG